MNKNSFIKSVLLMSLIMGQPIIGKDSKNSFICPNCRKEHFDSRGYCSKECFIEHKKKAKKGEK